MKNGDQVLQPGFYHNSENAQVLQCWSYHFGGDQDSIQVFNGVENFEFRLFSKYVYGDVEYPKAMKQVRISQLQFLSLVLKKTITLQLCTSYMFANSIS